MKQILVAVALLLCWVCGNGQQAKPGKTSVFIDCSRTWCDRTFIISEIKSVDFVLDRLVADVHVLITSQPGGGGGRNYQLIFYGQHAFSGKSDTLHCSTPATATEAEIRETMVHYLKLGLVPYVYKTAQAALLRIDMKRMPKNTAAAEPTRDKWNYWVFRVGANGEINGEQVYKSSRVSSDISASRTTEKLKAEFYIYGSKRKSVYSYEDNGNGAEDLVVENSDFGFFHNIVRSFDAHWSYGYQASISNNTFSNFRRKIYFNPAIEYNIYPYQEVNSRFFVVRYGLDVTNYDFYDSTIYNLKAQTLYGHRFSMALTLNQRWGNFNSGLYFRNYFHDWTVRSMGININVEARITGGLSFYVHTSGGIVHDQVYLKKGGATEQEILTRRRQLASSFNYRTSFGVNYRFGSVLNNFVNPRFDGYGGF